nr:hypothetical protein L204_06100 [Cryptococcus depauperatus CBS 7855]
MSLQDRLTAQDTVSLLSTGATLSLVVAGSVTGGSYNFALFFLLLVAISAFYDLYLLLFRSHSTLIWVISLLVLLIKGPVWFSGLGVLRERGGDLGELGGIPGFSRFSGSGERDWNLPMPGGFATQDAGAGNAPTQAQGQFPSSGGFRLGGDEEEQGHTPGGPSPGRNGYQTIG